MENSTVCASNETKATLSHSSTLSTLAELLAGYERAFGDLDEMRWNAPTTCPEVDEGHRWQTNICSFRCLQEGLASTRWCWGICIHPGPPSADFSLKCTPDLITIRLGQLKTVVHNLEHLHWGFTKLKWVNPSYLNANPRCKPPRCKPPRHNPPLDANPSHWPHSRHLHTHGHWSKADPDLRCALVIIVVIRATSHVSPKTSEGKDSVSWFGWRDIKSIVARWWLPHGCKGTGHKARTSQRVRESQWRFSGQSTVKTMPHINQ